MGGVVGFGGCTEGAAGFVCCTEGVADFVVDLVVDMVAVVDLVVDMVAEDEVLLTTYCGTLDVTDDVTMGDTGYLQMETDSETFIIFSWDTVINTGTCLTTGKLCQLYII